MLAEWDKAVTDLSKNDDIIAKIITDYPEERMEMKNDTLHTLVRSDVGQQISASLAGQQSVEMALANSQKIAVREMTRAGYIK